MSFHDVTFPVAISFGSTGGPQRRTEIVTLASGHEQRNSLWRHSLRRYDAGIGVRSLQDIATIIAFFEAREGRRHTFRWKDWADYTSCPPGRAVSPSDQSLGAGDGAKRSFRLIKTYGTGDGAYARPITLPITSTLRIAVGGAEIAQGSGYSWTDGHVVLATAPADGAAITAGFTFHVPVRFDTDRLEINLATFAAGEIPSIPVLEVRR